MARPKPEAMESFERGALKHCGVTSIHLTDSGLLMATLAPKTPTANLVRVTGDLVMACGEVYSSLIEVNQDETITISLQCAK